MSSKYRNRIGAVSEPFIDTNTLAQHLGVSPRTIQGWVLKKKIPCYHISPKCLRFKLSEILDYVETRKIEPVALKRFKMGRI